MKLFFVSLLLLAATLLPAQNWGNAKLDTWIAADPMEQLYNEGAPVLKGTGLLFVPAMTDADSEPFYTVFDQEGEEVIDGGPMGTSTALLPGEYIIMYGSGTGYQRLAQTVNIVAENVTFPALDWGCLTVNLLDTSRNSLQDSYELFDDNGLSYGIGYGADTELGEKLRTWVLPPGRYKIIFNGAGYTTYTNFATCDIEAGALTRFTCVINTESNSLTGAGILDTDEDEQLNATSRVYSAVHANISISSDNETNETEHQTSIVLNGQFDNRYTYESSPYYYHFSGLLEAGTSKEKDSDTFRTSSDDLTLRNTFIYYFIKGLGLYGRVDIATHLFKRFTNTTNPQDYLLYDENDNLIKAVTQTRKLQVQDNFFPMQLKEGVGLNLRLFNNPRATLSLRSGFGLRQDINKDSYVLQSTVSDSLNPYYGYQVYKQATNNSQEGVEMSLVGNFQITNNISCTTNADYLIPFDRTKHNTLQVENIFNLRLFKYISIDWRLNLNYNREVQDYLLVTQSLFLRLTYYIY